MKRGYAGRPILKPPVWTWEVPLYFFAGGAAGASACIALAALLLGREPALAGAALWVAAVGGAASPVLLTLDLGRPLRAPFVFRVFKLRSPMSVGSWTLLAFGVRRMNIRMETGLEDLESGKPGLRQWTVLGIFVVIILFWLTEELHSIDAGIIALAGAVGLFLLGLIQEGDFNHINWNALITFGGGMAIGNVLVMTGVSLLQG